jgi:hypothetical protein
MMPYSDVEFDVGTDSVRIRKPRDTKTREQIILVP